MQSLPACSRCIGCLLITCLDRYHIHVLVDALPLLEQEALVFNVDEVRHGLLTPLLYHHTSTHLPAPSLTPTSPSADAHPAPVLARGRALSQPQRLRPKAHPQLGSRPLGGR